MHHRRTSWRISALACMQTFLLRISAWLLQPEDAISYVKKHQTSWNDDERCRMLKYISHKLSLPSSFGVT